MTDNSSCWPYKLPFEESINMSRVLMGVDLQSEVVAAYVWYSACLDLVWFTHHQRFFQFRAGCWTKIIKEGLGMIITSREWVDKTWLYVTLTRINAYAKQSLYTTEKHKTYRYPYQAIRLCKPAFTVKRFTHPRILKPSNPSLSDWGHVHQFQCGSVGYRQSILGQDRNGRI